MTIFRGQKNHEIFKDSGRDLTEAEVAQRNY